MHLPVHSLDHSYPASFNPTGGVRDGPSETARRQETEILQRRGGQQGPPAGQGDRADIVRQYRLVEDLQQRLSACIGIASDPTDDLYAEELAAVQNELETEEDKLSSFIEELKSLGVELKGQDGLCDFRSMRDGREVYLCWRLGEPEVQYWHELDAGFAGRQPLTASAPPARAVRTIGSDLDARAPAWRAGPTSRCRVRESIAPRTPSTTPARPRKNREVGLLPSRHSGREGWP